MDALQRLQRVEFDRIVAGGVPDSAQTRLKSLAKWGGLTSTLTPPGLAAAEELGLESVGHVLGAAPFERKTDARRPTIPGLGRTPRRGGEARTYEHTGHPRAWAFTRQRALGRLIDQARTLRADAVVGITADRRVEILEGQEFAGELLLMGTAVRFRGRRRRADPPVLALAGAQELLLLDRAGVEPLGVAGGDANVETWVGGETMDLMSGRKVLRAAELEDLTAGVYDARRLATRRLEAEGRALGADGLIGLQMAVEHRTRKEALTISHHLTVHLLATAVRRRHGHRGAGPAPVVDVSGGLDG